MCKTRFCAFIIKRFDISRNFTIKVRGTIFPLFSSDYDYSLAYQYSYQYTGTVVQSESKTEGSNDATSNPARGTESRSRRPEHAELRGHLPRICREGSPGRRD